MKSILAALVLLAVSGCPARAALRLISLKSPKAYLLSNAGSPDSNYRFLALDVPPNTIAVVYGISTYKSMTGIDSNGMHLYELAAATLGSNIDPEVAYTCADKIRTGAGPAAVNCYVLPTNDTNCLKFRQQEPFDFIKYYSRANFRGGAVSIKLAPRKKRGQLYFAVRNFDETAAAAVMIEAVAITDYTNVAASSDKPDEGTFLTDSVTNKISYVIPPRFKGEITAYLATTIIYPEAESERGIEGRVGVEFIVHADGTIGDIKCIKKTNSGLDMEAMRVISLMPRWSPGREGGEDVNVHFRIPITFHLD